MQWLALSFSVISTGGGIALFSIRDLSPLTRFAAQALVVLGVIIAVPAAINAAETVNAKLQEWGVWQKVQDARDASQRREAERQMSVSFNLRNSTNSTLEVEFSSESGDYWPGGNQIYVLNPGEAGNYGLQCRFANQKICFGAWVQGNSSSLWGVGYKQNSGCNSCCINCGQTYSTNLVNQ